MKDNIDYLIKLERAADYKCQNNLTFMCYWVDLMSTELLTPDEVGTIRNKLHLDRMANNIDSHHFAILEFIAEQLCPEDMCRLKGLEAIENSLIKSMDGGREYLYNGGKWELVTWEF